MKLRVRILSILAAALIIAAGIGGYFYYNFLNRDFTPWMTTPEVTVFFKSFEPVSPDGTDYWKKGHWITAVEGRWVEGMPQYRFRYGPVPEKTGHEWKWFWYLDMDQMTYGTKLKEYGDQGFTLVWYNSYERPDGSRRFQAVWHELKRAPAK